MDNLSCSWQTTDFVQIQAGDFLNKGVYIWVFNYDKIPHLGLSVHGKYCSATIHGAQILEPADKFFRWIQTKDMLTFFVHVTVEPASEIWANLFTDAIQNNETCLYPIKKSLGFCDANIQTLADLLHCFEENNKTQRYLSNQQVNKLYLNHYTKEDVLEMIGQKKFYAVRK